MKPIGLIGGMSWESTAVYYRHLNEQVRRRLGGLHSADILLRSFDFARIVDLQTRGAWTQAAAELADAAGALEAAGAGVILICTNTMHKVAAEVQAAIGIPLLHIADTTGAAVVAAGCRRPLLLATRYTMEQTFYVDRLTSRHGLAPLLPDAAERAIVHGVIFDELCQGILREDSRTAFRAIMEQGRRNGADSVILGCTEIGLLVGPSDIDLPVFDSTLLHADAALDLMSVDEVEGMPALRSLALG
ncbi:aspartate/glutamate racemase family protein [Telmatospirillum siberiense]|uniref:Aspartate racemase n=1 Tax=Telmatospirillum siberiense TaxID=382514 RepID=A0A2N3PY99_9PROT|nr:aspartate/glutamate racemase family protein [Telmatospirillum siberiense]PKU25363.1 aspartate racemase [Telmatospirillum siberiense]